MTNNSNTKLYAIYDLGLSPCSYDFFQFMISAELHRKRYKFKHLNIIFVHGTKQGFVENNLRSYEQNKQFFLNVLLPGSYLFKSVNAVQTVANRNELNKLNLNINNTFPRGYTINSPMHDFLLRSVVMARLRREEPVFFEAPDYALRDVRKLIDNFSTNKKILTLTVRELDREDNGSRTINYKEWKHAFKKLKDDYLPIVIRDSCNSFDQNVLFEDAKEFNIFSNHIHYRQALYELSDINFFKNNGPVILGLYGKSKSINFNEVDESIIALSTNWMKVNFGMNKGQLPLTTQNKNNFYGKENSANIVKFAKEDNDKNSLLPHEFQNAEEIVLSVQISIENTIQNLKKSIFIEDLNILRAISEFTKQKLISTQNLKEYLVSLEGKIIPKETVNFIEEMAKENNTKVFY